MLVTHPEKDQATQPAQLSDYQSLGRQEAFTNPAARANAQTQEAANLATDADGNAQTDEENDGAIPGPGVSGANQLAGINSQ